MLGTGPGGEDVAGRLAEAGLDVVGIEDRLVGRECPYWGCVPTKMMIRAAHALAEARRIPGLAGAVEVTPDWAPVARRIRDEATDDWDDAVAIQRFEGKGGRFVRGRGRLGGPGRVRVGDHLIEASRGVVIATGTSPAVPPIPGLADLPCEQAIPFSPMLTTTRLGLDRAELFTTAAAVAVSSSLYIAQGHPYLARGVVGDLVGLVVLSIVVIRWGRRLRHEALLCLLCIGVVLTLDPDWPLRLQGLLWWSAVTAAVAVYLVIRNRCLRRHRCGYPRCRTAPGRG